MDQATVASFETAQVGDRLPPVIFDPISRTTLALYCGASGDHNPIHIDSDFAKAHGMPDVFAHGMLVMAYMARVVTDWMPQSALRGYSTRFLAITQLHDAITCTGTVTDRFEEAGEIRLRVAMQAANQDGEVKLSGEAVLALP